jgi:hypothetical protein
MSAPCRRSYTVDGWLNEAHVDDPALVLEDDDKGRDVQLRVVAARLGCALSAANDPRVDVKEPCDRAVYKPGALPSSCIWRCS